jgi:hypothetical protein
MPTTPLRILGLLAAVALSFIVFAQPFPPNPGPGFDPTANPNRFPGRSGPRDPRAGVPTWSNDPAFRADTFTFVRLRYGSRRRGGWSVDYPGADLNFSRRLQELSSMRVDPDGLVLDIEDPRLLEFPFSFIIDPRSLDFTRGEAEALRRYLQQGGFLMIDDIWGQGMWDHLAGEIDKVLPGHSFVSLPRDHPLFHLPYRLPLKPQVPSEDSAHRTRDLPDPYRTWEDEISWEPPQPADYRAYLDDRGRIMILVCWNTDLSDGWEEEGVSPWFFENYAEKLSYPMGINIVFHLMTH